MKQYLLMVDENLSQALLQLFPGIQLLEVQGIPAGNEAQFTLLNTPNKPGVPETTVQTTEPLEEKTENFSIPELTENVPA